jgi:hypothetical protein
MIVRIRLQCRRREGDDVEEGRFRYAVAPRDGQVCPSRALPERAVVDAATPAPDEGKWFVIGHVPSKQLAEGSAKAFVSAGDGPAEDFRVQRLRAPAD